MTASHRLNVTRFAFCVLRVARHWFRWGKMVECHKTCDLKHDDCTGFAIHTPFLFTSLLNEYDRAPIFIYDFTSF